MTETKPTKEQIIAYMKGEVEQHLDCRKVKMTSLAEDAADYFDDYGPEPECKIPDEYFEYSFEVSEWWDKQQRESRRQ